MQHRPLLDMPLIICFLSSSSSFVVCSSIHPSASYPPAIRASASAILPSISSLAHRRLSVLVSQSYVHPRAMSIGHAMLVTPPAQSSLRSASHPAIHPPPPPRACFLVVCHLPIYIAINLPRNSSRHDLAIHPLSRHSPQT